jgi:hypothetical protein
MKVSKRIYTLLALTIFVTLGVAFTTADAGYKNLKVLNKNISHEELGKVMHDFNDALGVKCDFCHAPSKEPGGHPDFASDEKGEKKIAREMMKMTNKINKKFFHGKTKLGDKDALLAVGCATCHHGSPHPEFEKEEEQKQ